MALIMMTRIAFTLFLLLAGGLCYGQNQLATLISPAGGSYHNASFRVLWTLGEITGGTTTIKNFRVHQGFIQPKSTQTITRVDQELSSLLLSVYPNPTDEFLSITWSNPVSDLQYRLFDSQGVLLETWKTENALQIKKLDISDYAPGIYLLVIDSQSLKQNMKFKIIKAYTP